MPTESINKAETWLYYDISFVMSVKKCQSFVLALSISKGQLLSHTTLSNGHSELKRSKHEFIARVVFKSELCYNKFIEEFSGESESIDIIGGCACPQLPSK